MSGHSLRAVLSACDVNVTFGDVPMFGRNHVVLHLGMSQFGPYWFGPQSVDQMLVVGCACS